MSRTLTRSSVLYRVLAFIVVASLLAVPGLGVDAHQESQDVPGLPAQAVIFEQLDAGKIDYDTSLVYRAYALFDVERLPSDILDDADAIGEDHAFFGEVRYHWPQLSAETQALLTPYVVRPNDSRSVFFQAGARANEVAGQNQTDDSPQFAGGDCSDNWAAKPSPAFPFKVWIHCTGDYEAELDAAIAMVEEFWEIEVALMGPPRPDTGSEEQGGDTRLDIYFVEDEQDRVDRRGGDYISEEALAHAAPDDPLDGRKASSYIVARREYIGKPEQAIILAHEFFHSLQHAHNWQVSWGFKAGPYSPDFDTIAFSQFWYVEASATWMMWHVYRDKVDPEVMQNLVHFRFIKYFDGYERPLYYAPRQGSGGSDRVYAAYIYFVFLEQEIGPEAIGEMWRQFEDVEADDFERMLAIIDELLPFEDHFRDFAVRNLNLALEPGDPISPSYKDIDPAFPEGIHPPLQNGADGTSRTTIDVTGDDPLAFEDAIASLSAHYYDFSVARPVKSLTFDFTGLAANGALDVDMIAKVRNQDWERRPLPTDQSVTLCFGNPADEVSMFYLVLSNHDPVEANPARGTFTIEAGDIECT